MPRYENKYYAEDDPYEDSYGQMRYGTFVQKRADVRFPDPGPIHECVLAGSSECQNRIQVVLLGSQGINPDCEW